MATQRWKQSKTCVYNTSYHLIWCPKYRRKVLQGKVAERLKEILHEKADELGVEIASLEILPDHVHLFVKAKPIHAPQFLANQFKGYSSFVLRKEFSFLKTRLPTLWTRSYYVESVGRISEHTIKKYIEDQKNQ